MRTATFRSDVDKEFPKIKLSERKKNIGGKQAEKSVRQLGR